MFATGLTSLWPEHPQFAKLEVPSNLLCIALQPLEEDLFASWYPVEEEGDERASHRQFDAWRETYGTPRDLWRYLLHDKRWPSDQELPEDKSLMAYMIHTPPSKEQREPNHDVRNLGSAYYFGGWQRHLDPTTRLRGPLWFGKDVKARSSVKVIGPCIIGDRVLLDSSTMCTRSIIGHGSVLQSGVRVHNAIIGSNVRICSGARLQEEALIPGSVTVKDYRPGAEGRLHEPSRITGPVIGDGCIIGANTVLSPWTILLPGCIVRHGQVIGPGIYTPESLRSSN